MEEEPPVSKEDKPPKIKTRNKDTDEEEETTVTLTKEDITGLTSSETGLTSNTGTIKGGSDVNGKDTNGSKGRKRRKRK